MCIRDRISVIFVMDYVSAKAALYLFK